MSLIQELNHLKIPLEDIKLATENFSDSNFIGHGGFGRVYRGRLPVSTSATSSSSQGTMVAVKRLDMKFGQGQREFLMEIVMLASYKHDNVVSLVGFCDEGNEKIIVYEHEVHGSLDNHLESDLTWVQRINICLGAARGLNYLHSGVGEGHRVLHRDIKSSNILLDNNWKAKISDFGLSKIGPTNQDFTFLVTNGCGTWGYVDPVYVSTGVLTKESDVYSFGVLLFEVLCGRLAVIGKYDDERRFLSHLARLRYEEGKIDDIIFPKIRNQIKHNSSQTFSEIAYQCLNMDRKRRPTMAEIVERLRIALELQLVSSVFTLSIRMASTFLADLKPKDRNKIIEVKIYRTWIVRFLPNPAPKLLCCMLLDKAGNAIQATMSINGIEYFKPIVEVNKAYKISNFFCEETKSKQHTLPNPTTLRFGRATTSHPIPLDGFPSHHFNFISYNQLYSSLEKSPILIDYIGCIQNVGVVTRSTDPNKNQVDKRSIDIINLNGNIVEFTMWDKMAMNFDISSMPKPVMIVVTSCRVQQFQNQLQLSATQATHYYLNPDIEEVNHSLPKYKTMFTANPPLQVVKQKYPDHEKEKTRNRYSLGQLIAQNPLSYKSVRFTCEGSIVSLSTSDNWYQYTCRKCKKKLMSDTPPFECRDDGLQPEPEISYCFRAIVVDDTTTAPFVFFSPNADVVPNIKCIKLVKKQGYSNPKEIPPALEAIKGKRHIFQFHFNQSSKKGIVEFVFDAFLDSPKPDTGKRPTFEDLDNTNEMDIKRQKSTPIIDE